VTVGGAHAGHGAACLSRRSMPVTAQHAFIFDHLLSVLEPILHILQVPQVRR
jgi:hypothetical protein